MRRITDKERLDFVIRTASTAAQIFTCWITRKGVNAEIRAERRAKRGGR